MAFERKILKTVVCPRCNGKAEIRIIRPVELSGTERVFVYTICPTCRLKKYEYATTEQAIKVEVKIMALQDRLKNTPVNSSASRNILAKIEDMRRLKTRLEFGL